MGQACVILSQNNAHSSRKTELSCGASSGELSGVSEFPVGYTSYSEKKNKWAGNVESCLAGSLRGSSSHKPVCTQGGIKQNHFKTVTHLSTKRPDLEINLMCTFMTVPQLLLMKGLQWLKLETSPWKTSLISCSFLMEP